jgi:hypothetical protein
VNNLSKICLAGIGAAVVTVAIVLGMWPTKPTNTDITATTPIETLSEHFDPNEIVTKYTNPDGVPFELVYTSQQRLILRVDTTSYDQIDHVGKMDLLRVEVTRLVSATEPIEIGGMCFEFRGGYPIWGPHTSIGPGYRMECLLFAEQAEINGDTITARGSDDYPSYYPYTLLTGKPTGKRKADIGAWYAWAHMGLNAQYAASHDVNALGS